MDQPRKQLSKKQRQLELRLYIDGPIYASDCDSRTLRSLHLLCAKKRARFEDRPGDGELFISRSMGWGSPAVRDSGDINRLSLRGAYCEVIEVRRSAPHLTVRLVKAWGTYPEGAEIKINQNEFTIHSRPLRLRPKGSRIRVENVTRNVEEACALRERQRGGSEAPARLSRAA